MEPGKTTLSGEILQHSVGIRATLEAVARAIKEGLAAGLAPSGPNKRIGIGVASAFKNVGAGKGNPDNGGAILELTPEGTILLRASGVEMGQGLRTALVQLASQAAGISPSCFQLIVGTRF